MQADMLKSRIAAAGYDLKTLAAELKLSKQTLSDKINGKRAFNTDEIVRICELLSIVDNNEKALIFLRQPSQKRDSARRADHDAARQAAKTKQSGGRRYP